MSNQEVRLESAARRGRTDTFLLTPKLIRGFLKEKEQAQRSRQTLTSYRRSLQSFCDFLGQPPVVTEQSLPQWREYMLQEGYASSTVTSRVSTVNSFFDYQGRRNWQITEGKRAEVLEQTELSREEYLALLREAKRQDNIQSYLLIKVMASTDLTPSDMPLLTREAVDRGLVTGRRKKSETPLPLSEPLREELLEYARQHGIRQGPVFLSSRGDCHSRCAVNRMVRQIAEDAGIDFSKANPRNLRRMHLNTLADLRRQADAWVEERYSFLLTQEESAIGWRI